MKDQIKCQPFSVKVGDFESKFAAETDLQKPKWMPHKASLAETPFCFFLGRLLPLWYRVRNALLRNAALDIRLPCVPRAAAAPRWLQHVHLSFTLGELLVLSALVGGTVAFSVLAIVNKWSVSTTGVVAGYPVIFVFAFASRNSLATFLLGIPFERALFWHKILGSLVVVTLTWVHGARVFLGGGVAEGEREAEAQPHGLILGAIFTAFPALSPWFFRRRFFTAFFVVHIALVLSSAVASYIHGFWSIFIGLGLWGFDVGFRYLYLCLLTAPKTCTATRLPGNVIRLSFSKATHDHFQYSAGQYVFIMVPGVNIFEWHPFSISSAPHQNFVSVHIRVLGNWTRSLHDLITAKGGGPTEIPAYFEGPYGAPEIDIDADKYKLFLLISGGIGITPMQSVANSLVHQHHAEGRPLRKVWFVWSCAEKQMLGEPLAVDVEAPSTLPLSFQPDTISRRLGLDAGLSQRRLDGPWEDDGPLLHTELFLTRAKGTPAPDQPALRYGRPDLDRIFSTFQAYAKNVQETRIAVMVCGPTTLTDDVRRLCDTFTCSNVRFDYHSEMFEF